MDQGSDSLLENLRRATTALLDERRPPFSLRPEVQQAAECLHRSTAGSFHPADEIDRGETRTAHGLCLSPTMAAMCADDYVRTIVFLRGLHRAILDALVDPPRRPVRVLYAGCGPLATLALPLLSVLDESQVRFTLVDIHHESIASVRTAVQRLGVGRSVADLVAIDALNYRIDPGNPPDLLVIETMQACLAAEPQVAITRHLAAQAPDAVLIPETVRIELRLVDPAAAFGDADRCEAEEERLGPVFELSRRSLPSFPADGEVLSGASVVLPDPWPGHLQAMLFTTIRVHGEHRLEARDSGLTSPRVLPFDGPVRPGDRLRFSYHLGRDPQLRCHRLEP